MSATQTKECLRPITVSLEEVYKITGLRTTKIYELLSAGKLTSCRVGTRRLVFYDSLEKFLHDNAA
jgi:excisionase family DNA binding protein